MSWDSHTTYIRPDGRGLSDTPTATMSGQDLMSSSRAEQRKQRLLEAEREVAREEAEALKLTEEQRLALLRPFTSVKAEFTDLDGLRWTQTALRYHQPPNLRRPSHVSGSGSSGGHFFSSATATSTSPDSKTFVVLTNSDLTSFSGEDTVRPSARSSRPGFSPLLSIALYSPKSTKGLKKTTTRQVISVDDLRGHRNGTRTRSPVKGLFLGTTEEGSTAASPSKIVRIPQRAPGRPTPAIFAINQLSVSLSDEGDVGAGPPGLSRAPTYSLAPPLSSPEMTSRGTSALPPSISVTADEAALGSDQYPGVSATHPLALYDTRNPAAYGYALHDATPYNDHSLSQISTYHVASRSTTSLVSVSSPLSAAVPSPAPATQSASAQLLSEPCTHSHVRHSPRARLQSLLHDDRPSTSQSSVRGFDFPLPPQSPPGLAPNSASMTRRSGPGSKHEARETSPPPGVRFLAREGDVLQDGDIGIQAQSVRLTHLDLSYRYAFDAAYESESDDDMTPTPSPTFSPGELNLGSGVALPTNAAPALTGNNWYRPWMASA